jgi:hypothetical protein
MCKGLRHWDARCSISGSLPAIPHILDNGFRRGEEAEAGWFGFVWVKQE